MPGERKYGQDHGHYAWSPIVARARLRWPDEARVALCVIINLEHWDWAPPEGTDQPSGGFAVNIPAFAQREYGNRVGVFRLFDMLEKYGITPTIAMDRAIAEHYPFLARQCQTRGLEVIAHGATARRPIHAGMSMDDERAYIRASIDAVTGAVGVRPVGWLGPDFHESVNTPSLLAAEGIRYVCDWSNDEQPYRMIVPQGELFSLGVDLDLDDVFIHLDGRRLIDEYRQIVQDTFDGLYRDGVQSGRLMVINIHPWIMGQPWRSKYLDRALAHIAAHEAVWKATGRDIIDWYQKTA